MPVIAVIYSSGFSIESTPDETARSLYQQSVKNLAAGDTSSAGNLLDRALELDPKLWEARLERGRVHLAAGDLDAARVDFNRALFSKSPEIRARAHIGLGDIFRRMPHRNWQAVQEYRLAISADSTCREAYYAIAETAFDLAWTDGFITADAALAKLICLDPEYKDALIQWWEKVFTQSDKELRKVVNCLEDFVATHPEKSPLLLYAAKIRFRLGEAESAMITLDRLKTESPEHKRSERSLLAANCLLELGDTLGFESSYMEALKYAEEDGDFAMLFQEAEPLFNPVESKKWAALETPAEKAAFFHVFWKRRDPDPISTHNERLIEHYKRLSEAKKTHFHLTPHSIFMTNYNYFRLTAPRVEYSDRDDYFDFDYKPDLWWGRCRQLALQQRGLFYIRHGEPDMLYRFGLPLDGGTEKESPYEAWRYGTNYILFDRENGFYWAEKSYAEQGDIMRAMESESFKDPLPTLNHASYGADFKGSGGKLEIEFYQSLPVTVNNTPIEKHKATIVIYDESWIEMVRKDTESNKVFTGQDSMWFAVNSVTVDLGPIIYALRMNVPGYRSVTRKSIAPSPYSEGGLELSGVILGSPPLPGEQVHRRRGVEILPRPSLAFRRGETIKVYLEVYGLKQNRTLRRFFTEKVTVSLVEEKADENIIKRLFGIKQPRTSLTLSFDRYPSEARGPFAEHFNIDTSDLVPGSYNLLIEVIDKNSRQRKKTVCFFELAERE